MAASPPRRSTSAAPASSSSVMQSHIRFESPQGTISARWPIANAGSVPMPAIVPSSRSSFAWPAASSASVVHRWPAGGTYWRGSMQIGHSPGGPSESANWVPQATQMYRAMPGCLQPAGALERAVQQQPGDHHQRDHERIGALPAQLGHMLEVHPVEGGDER